MNAKQNLVLVNNEKIFSKENKFFCDNIDMKSIPEELGKNFKIETIARTSKINRSHKINIAKINLAKNLFVFLSNIYKTFKNKDTKYLLISITPYTFCAYLLLFFFKKKIYVYLRSNGYEEYKAILGFIGPLIYHLMFILVTYKSKVITCQSRLIKKKANLVFPSEIDYNWKTNTLPALLDKPRLLYVGRIKVEKGIFSLIKIINEMSDEINLSIVGRKEAKNLYSKKINYLGYGFDVNNLKKIYDDHNILILPSFTEAHPKIIDEALSRFRPIIIFKEIEHIIGDRSGIFVANRNASSLKKTIDYIMENYEDIKKKIEKNKLPTKEKFIKDMVSIINA